MGNEPLQTIETLPATKEKCIGFQALSRRLPQALLVLGLFVVFATVFVAKPVLAQSAPEVDYATQIQPFFADYCYACHGANPILREADLRLDKKEFAFTDLVGGLKTIVPGKPEESVVFARINSDTAEDRMPPYTTGIELTKEQKEMVRLWIEQGPSGRTRQATRSSSLEQLGD